MLRFSLATRQASKRMIAKLASINAKKAAADAKSSSSTTATATAPVTGITSDVNPAMSAAATGVRAVAEDTLQKKVAAVDDGGGAMSTKPVMKSKKMKKLQAARRDEVTPPPTTPTTTQTGDGSTHNDAKSTAAVTDSHVAREAPPPVAEEPKERNKKTSLNNKDDNSDDHPREKVALEEKTEKQEPHQHQPMKKKKKKLMRASSSVNSQKREVKGEEKISPTMTTTNTTATTTTTTPVAAVATAPAPTIVKEEAFKPPKAEKKKDDRKKELSSKPVSLTKTPPIQPEEEKNPPSQQKTPMIKAFRVEDVLSACTVDDGVFARRLPQGGCQFFAWPGTPLAVASNAVATMPDTIRTVHAIFGREKTPIDLVMDIDCPVPQEHWSMSKVRPFQKKVLDDILTVVSAEIEAIGEKIDTQVVLQSPNLKKVSFHVHTKLKDVAFEDYHSLHGFLYRFHKKIPSVDLQIYRTNGMLRMHRCMKENHTSAIVVFEDKKWNIGFPTGVVPDSIAALHSACIREAGTYSRLLHFDAPRSQIVHDESGNSLDDGTADGAFRPIRVLLPRTEREAVENVSTWLRTGIREPDVGEWRSWIKIGINTFRIAHHFRDAPTLDRPAMEELLEAWVEASKKCPTKYRHGVCEAKWANFDIDKLCRGQENDWWSSYQRIGRLAIANMRAEKGEKAATSQEPSSKAK